MKNLSAGKWRFPSFFICCLFSICSSSIEIFPATDVLFNFTQKTYTIKLKYIYADISYMAITNKILTI